MPEALLVLGGIAYIGLSLFFKFTPRLRVLVGLLVGSLLAGVVTDQVITWLGKGTGAVAGPLGNLIGQSPRSTATAIPTVIAFCLAVVVVMFLRGRKGGAGGKSAAGKHGGGGGGRAGGLATAALVCAVLLPIVAGSVGEAIRSVT